MPPPAYVHITQRSMAEHARLAADFRSRSVYSVGRPGEATGLGVVDESPKLGNLGQQEERGLAEDSDARRQAYPILN